MTIEWDRNHLSKILDWVSSHHGLVVTKLVIETADMEDLTFAVSVDEETKCLHLLSNPEWSMMDVTMNVLMAYIICLAYDRDGWDSDSPSPHLLSAVHEEVCETLSELNSLLGDVLFSQENILQRWVNAYNGDPVDGDYSTFNNLGTSPLVESSDSREEDDLDSLLGGQNLFGFAKSHKEDDWGAN